MGDHSADIDKHVKVYVVVFVSLLALTLITVAISYLRLPLPYAVAVALAVACTKGSLVACYFMHLISEKRLIFMVLALTVVLFLALMMLPIFTVANRVQVP
jgi:caa(3)-type oxidase subunit IV